MNTKLNNELYDFLIDFGLSEREVTLYFTLLKTGPNTIMNLARETGIKRSTAHNNVEELIKKGLISQTNYGERRMVIAEDPEKLKFLMEQKKWQVKKLEENLPTVIQGIAGLVPESSQKNNVEVKYYDGTKGVMSVYEEALSSTELKSYVNLEKIKNIFPENSNLFVNAQKKNKDLTIYEIVEDSAISRKLTKQFQVSNRYFFKFAPKGLKLTSADVMIFDRKVVVVNATERPTATVILNEEYYLCTKAIFDYVWNSIS